MTLEEIRQAISSCKINFDELNTIASGTIKNSSNEDCNFFITCGWDIVTANIFNKNCKSFMIEQFDNILSLNLEEDKEKEILNNIIYEDDHWDWFNKSISFKEDNYKWFFFFINNKPQAICITYNPKTSILSNNNIFYIEYLAVAPWNRKNALYEREYAGIGSKLIKFIQNYFIDQFGYNAGFSLHSLPQATTYYLDNLRMQNIESEDKANLKYFELSNENAIALIGDII
ncbi:hypothetical protein [Aliarcobacter butzleri]|uniref:hypothetical protein n=1 Tax=Aliarcobacter butzleri TaxID=28197 RepID=UPI003B225B27